MAKIQISNYTKKAKGKTTKCARRNEDDELLSKIKDILNG